MDRLFDQIYELKEHPKVFEKKVKQIPGVCVVNMAELPDSGTPKNFALLDPSLNPVIGSAETSGMRGL